MTASLRVSTGQSIRFDSDGVFRSDLDPETLDTLLTRASREAEASQIEPFSYVPVFEAGERLGLWTIEDQVHDDDELRVY